MCLQMVYKSVFPLFMAQKGATARVDSYWTRFPSRQKASNSTRRAARCMIVHTHIKRPSCSLKISCQCNNLYPSSYETVNGPSILGCVFGNDRDSLDIS